MYSLLLGDSYMSQNRLRYLIEQYANDRSTPEEVKELFAWIESNENKELLKAEIEGLWRSQNDPDVQYQVDWETVFAGIKQGQQGQQVQQGVVRPMWRKIAAAAVLVGILVSAAVWFSRDHSEQGQLTVDAARDVLAPDVNRATITLSDGTTVYLDSVFNGQVALQGDVAIMKLDSGQIDYRQTASMGEQGTGFNTLRNPRGSRVIQMMLNDGTRIWLNAGSSVTYPVRFVGNERNVVLSGEAFFNVAHDESKPFTVTKNETTVEVIGTEFNVNAYDDDDEIKVTLIGGAVRVNSRNSSEVLAPGQQAIVSRQNGLSIRESVNMDAVLAWVNGRFIFDGENIQGIMRQLARWYNVDVKYEGDVTGERFVGVFSRSRNQNISAILDMFKKTKTVNFEIRGRDVVVTPYTEN